MATNTPQSGQLSLLELASRTNNASALAIAEVLAQTNEFIQDAAWGEANGLTGHTFTRRTSLPSGSWRKLNDGVSAESSETKQFTETIGMLESFSQIDEMLVNLAPNPGQFRAQEDNSFIEGLGQTFATAFVYGDTTTAPEQFTGLVPRINTTGTTNGTAIDGGGSGSVTTSIYVVSWGPNGVQFIYPRNSSVGLSAEDLGRERVDGTTGTFMALVSHFKMDVGLMVRDDRAIQRIANIETAGSTNTFDDDDLITICNRVKSFLGTPVIYCNATIKTQMDIRAKDQGNINYQPSEFGGMPVTRFRGIPVREIEAITNTETAI